jgi:hypothetical protein
LSLFRLEGTKGIIVVVVVPIVVLGRRWKKARELLKVLAFYLVLQIKEISAIYRLTCSYKIYSGHFYFKKLYTKCYW